MNFEKVPGAVREAAIRPIGPPSARDELFHALIKSGVQVRRELNPSNNLEYFFIGISREPSTYNLTGLTEEQASALYTLAGAVENQDISESRFRRATSAIFYTLRGRVAHFRGLHKYENFKVLVLEEDSQCEK